MKIGFFEDYKLGVIKGDARVRHSDHDPLARERRVPGAAAKPPLRPASALGESALRARVSSHRLAPPGGRAEVALWRVDLDSCGSCRIIDTTAPALRVRPA